MQHRASRTDVFFRSSTGGLEHDPAPDEDHVVGAAAQHSRINGDSHSVIPFTLHQDGEQVTM